MQRIYQLPLWAFGAVLLLCIGVLVYWQQVGAAEPTEIRWFVAHEPSAVFVRAEKLLASELLKNSGEAYKVTFLTPKDMGLEGKVTPDAIVKLLGDGTVDLVSMNVDSVIALEKSKSSGATLDLEVLHLPYLFRDYESANKVLDGAVGGELLSLLDKAVPAHALAFTYSGGFRVVASAKGPLKNVADLKGQRINTWGSPTMQKSLAALGMSPVPVAIIGGGKDLIEKGQSDGVELTYTREEEAIGSNTKYVLETNHVLFLSALFASDAFYSSLSPKAKDILNAAAVLAAQTERADSIALNEQVRTSLIESGVSVMALSAADRMSLEQWASGFRTNFGMTAAMKALEQKILEAQQDR